MKLRQLFREQETPEVADVIVFWLDGDETVQHILYNVPVTEIRKSDFEDTLRQIIRRNFDRVLVRYQVVGDVTSQGNPDGNTPDTETPTVLTSPDNDEVEPVPQRPDEVEAPTADEIEAAIDAAADDAGVQNIEVEIIPDSDNEPLRIEVTPQDETEPPPSVNGVEIISPDELNRMLDDYADSVDQDGDGINDETGERVTRSSDLPPVSVPRLGGGLDGDTGDEGVEGEEGAVTGEQRAEIPSIIEELRRSLRGLGTNETRMINALKRIGSSAHLEAVVQMYRQEYDSSLPQDIIDEFKYDVGDRTAGQIEEINRVMRPLGWQIVGARYSTMRWQKYEGEES
jgi:hypothetical protein